MIMTDAARGHTMRAHTADEIVEAWGPTREACLEEAATCLARGIASVEREGGRRHREIELGGSDEELLVALLEEVIYLLDAEEVVPARVQVVGHGDTMLVHLWLTDLRWATPTGAAPKGISYSGLSFVEERPDRWRCTATVDV
jgi:SHS2 domain-containing protein